MWCVAAEEGLTKKYGTPYKSVPNVFKTPDWITLFTDHNSIISFFSMPQTIVDINLRKIKGAGLICADINYTDRYLSDLKSSEEKRDLTKNDFNAL